MTEFTCNREASNDNLNSKDLIGCSGAQYISTVKVSPGETVLLAGLIFTIEVSAALTIVDPNKSKNPTASIINALVWLFFFEITI
jgi:hypothetical protein